MIQNSALCPWFRYNFLQGNLCLWSNVANNKATKQQSKHETSSKISKHEQEQQQIDVIYRYYLLQGNVLSECIMPDQSSNSIRWNGSRAYFSKSTRTSQKNAQLKFCKIFEKKQRGLCTIVDIRSFPRSEEVRSFPYLPVYKVACLTSACWSLQSATACQ